MKKLICVMLLLTTLAACGSPSEEEMIINERFSDDSIGGSDIVTDTETGCKYLFFKSGYAGGLSPLYKSNGEIDCD